MVVNEKSTFPWIHISMKRTWMGGWTCVSMCVSGGEPMQPRRNPPKKNVENLEMILKEGGRWYGWFWYMELHVIPDSQPWNMPSQWKGTPKCFIPCTHGFMKVAKDDEYCFHFLVLALTYQLYSVLVQLKPRFVV